MTNNAQTNPAVQLGVANPPWGDACSDRLGYNGATGDLPQISAAMARLALHRHAISLPRCVKASGPL